MRHHNTNRKFGRVRRQRTALLRSLAVSLIDRENIRTTEAKAKELRPFVEKLVTKSRENSVSVKRLLISKLGSGTGSVVKKLTEDIAPKYKNRAGGYIRITKLPFRKGDGSPMAKIEFV